MEIIKREAFAPTSADIEALKSHMGLCGDEDVSTYLDAAVDHVERVTATCLRETQVSFISEGGHVVFPLTPVKRVDKVHVISRHGMRVPYGRFKTPLVLSLANEDCIGYEITYTAAPTEIPPVFRLAVFDVAHAFYDRQPPPDLVNGILRGYVPNSLQTFKRAFGGSLNTRVK